MQNVQEPRHYDHRRLETPLPMEPLPFTSRLAVQALVETMGARGLLCTADDRIAFVSIAQNKPARLRDCDAFWGNLERDANLGLQVIQAFEIRPDESAVARVIATVVPVHRDAVKPLTAEMLAKKAIAKRVLGPLDTSVKRYLALRQSMILNAAP